MPAPRPAVCLVGTAQNTAATPCLCWNSGLYRARRRGPTCGAATGRHPRQAGQRPGAYRADRSSNRREALLTPNVSCWRFHRPATGDAYRQIMEAAASASLLAAAAADASAGEHGYPCLLSSARRYEAGACARWPPAPPPAAPAPQPRLNPLPCAARPPVPLVGPMHVPCTISTMPVYEPETVLGSMLRPIELMADGTVVCLKVDSRGFIPAGERGKN